MRDFLIDLQSLFANTSARYELLLIAILVGVAFALARRVGRHVRGMQGDLQYAGLRRLAFPLIGVLLLGVARFAADHSGWSLHLVGVATRLLIALALVRIVVYALRRAFAPSGWLANFERSIAAMIWLVVALDALGLLPDLIQWLDGYSLMIGKSRLTLWSVMHGAVTVMAALILALWIGGLLEARLMAASIDRSVQVVLSRAVKALLVFVAVLVGASLAGLDLTTLSVFSGALGVGLGLGMQRIASNYVAGFIILLDRSIRIGDIIQVGSEQRGEVKQITTRYTVVRALNGIHYIVPNEALVSSVVQNETYIDTRTRGSLRVQVGYNADVDRAIAIMEELARAQPRVIADPAPSASLISFDDSGITLELGFWVSDPLKGTGGIRSDIGRELLRRFRTESIEIPFPQREVRIIGQGEAASGSAA
ncbi:mechanosensitive ion channel family protein [Uliginosibacterium sp. sgz301328]|uniref:mechanosensitive ion channel family protein n=1 Tax=Uliginosibacterium sp. sgz301328 TaxID=3243764 RepID=UPI00359ECBB9